METSAQKALISWLTSSGGIVHPSVDPFGHLPDGERGIFAAAGLRAGTRLITVPTTLCLHVPQCTADTAPVTAHSSLPHSKAAVWLSERVGELGQFLACVLLLMAEIAAGDTSFFAPEIAVLPASHSCLLAWTPAEAELLRGTALEGAEPDMREYFKEKVLPVMELRRDLWPGQLCGFRALLQAAGMVQSRTFHVNQADVATGSCLSEGSDLYLLPVIDMANHATLGAKGENAELQVAALLTRQTTVDDSDRCFVLIAKRDIVAGEEICISYGQLSDAELLQTYGFLEHLGRRCNAHNRVQIRPEDVYNAGKTLLRLSFGGKEANAKERWEKLEGAGIVAQDYFITAADPLPVALLTTILAMGLSEDAWEDYLAGVPAACASCEQHVPTTGHSGTAGHSPSTAAGAIPTTLCLGMDYIRILFEEGDGGAELLVLEGLLRVVQRQNPLHVGAALPALTGAQLDTILHEAPPRIHSVESGECSESVGSTEKSAYRVWCAKRVAAGELSILRTSLAVVAELREEAEEARPDDSEESDQSDSETGSPSVKRHKV